MSTADWRKVCPALETLRPSPLILVATQRRAAAMSIARSLEKGGDDGRSALDAHTCRP